MSILGCQPKNIHFNTQCTLPLVHSRCFSRHYLGSGNGFSYGHIEGETLKANSYSDSAWSKTDLIGLHEPKMVEVIPFMVLDLLVTRIFKKDLVLYSYQITWCCL